MMFGVAPATHELVLYGMIVIGVVIVGGIGALMLHAQWLHGKLKEHLKPPEPPK